MQSHPESDSDLRVLTEDEIWAMAAAIQRSWSPAQRRERSCYKSYWNRYQIKEARYEFLHEVSLPVELDLLVGKLPIERPPYEYVRPVTDHVELRKFRWQPNRQQRARLEARKKKQ